MYVRNTGGVPEMKKSVFSHVLMDDVIRAVDREAYKRGTSRSNLINQILAQHLSCVTPEMRMREIFGSVADLISGSFNIQQQRSASLMTLRTALDYKYRPTLNYKVELDRSPGEFIGTLRVQIRTQSAALITMFNSFFTYRAKLESSALAALDAVGRSKVYLTFPELKADCKTVLVLKAPKTASSVRTVYISKTVAEALLELKREQDAQKKSLHGLYEEGLLETEFASLNRDQITARCANDQTGVTFDFSWQMSTLYSAQYESYKADPSKGIIAGAAPLSGDNTGYYVGRNPISNIFGINAQFASFFGGTSLLITVGVVLDTLQQIESYLLMRHYDGLMKTGRLTGRSGM